MRTSSSKDPRDLREERVSSSKDLREVRISSRDPKGSPSSLRVLKTG